MKAVGHTLTAWDLRMLRCSDLHPLSSHKLPLEVKPAQYLFVRSIMDWVSMAELLHISLRLPCAKQMSDK